MTYKRVIQWQVVNVWASRCCGFVVQLNKSATS